MANEKFNLQKCKDICTLYIKRNYSLENSKKDNNLIYMSMMLLFAEEIERLQEEIKQLKGNVN